MYPIWKLRRIVTGLFLGVVPVFALDVLAPSGERIPMDSLRIRDGLLCLPQDTLTCFESLPVAPSPWQFHAEWESGATAEKEFQNVMQFGIRYERNGLDPWINTRIARDDTLHQGDQWNGELQMGADWGGETWMGSISTIVSKTVEEDTNAQLRIYQGKILPNIGSGIGVIWGAASAQYSSWKTNRGYKLSTGMSYFRLSGNWDFDISPSLHLQWFEELDPERQDAALVFCQNVETSNSGNLVCFESENSSVPQPKNLFKGALGYQFSGQASPSVWNSPNRWWMTSLSMENGYAIHSRWRLFYKGEASLKSWFDETTWSNANKGADVPDASGNLAVFRDQSSKKDYLLLLDGSNSFVEYRQSGKLQRDLLLYAAIGVEFKPRKEHKFSAQFYALQTRSNMTYDDSNENYFVLGMNLAWKGTW